ncbi:TM2 domain-containing protein [Xanthobacter sp. TB0136]|uniref:TM2 domain-containing protein n=1 Tax=Xanthobacter sp. TB0136 TaxID=3459177 RepID=UPI00403A708A
MSMDLQQQAYIEARLTNEGPSMLLAYVFWFFLGLLGAHRFYLGRPGSAVLQIITCLLLVGVLWVLADLFLIPGMVRARQDEIRRRIAHEMGLVPAAQSVTRL